ncbi:MAG: DUF4837 family protein [Candidatus Neomarinimicrobiota bacterium]
MKMPVRIILIASVVIIVGACGSLRDAIGDDNKIIVITPEPQAAAVRRALSTIFSDTLFTPQPEPLYVIQTAKVEEYNRYNTHVNFIVTGLGTDPVNPGNRLVKQLLPAASYAASKNGGEAIYLSHDQHAQNQLFLVLSARDEEHLVTELIRNRDWLKEQFDGLFEMRQGEYLFDKVRQEAVEKRIYQNFGWGMKIPWGFEILAEDSIRNFFWMGRDLPYRWISVQWQDGQQLVDSVVAGRLATEYPDQYYGNVRFTDYKFTVKAVDFADWSAWRVTGLWEEKVEPQGGPFVHYIFYDGITDRTYQVNLLIFFPGKDKAILMRQLDIIARSFFVEQ